MNTEEMLRHNDAIMEKISFEKLLTDGRAETDPIKRGNALIYSFCHMMYQQRTAGRSFDRQWIIDNIGRPNEEWTEDNGDQTLWYNLAFPCSPGISRQDAKVTLRNGLLAGFARSELLEPNPGNKPETRAVKVSETSPD